MPFAGSRVIWASTPFGDERRELLGRRARTIDLELLKAGKAHAREPEIDAVKDRADFDALTAHA